MSQAFSTSSRSQIVPRLRSVDEMPDWGNDMKSDWSIVSSTCDHSHSLLRPGEYRYRKSQGSSAIVRNCKTTYQAFMWKRHLFWHYLLKCSVFPSSSLSYLHSYASLTMPDETEAGSTILLCLVGMEQSLVYGSHCSGCYL